VHKEIVWTGFGKPLISWNSLNSQRVMKSTAQVMHPGEVSKVTWITRSTAKIETKNAKMR
jgi:hypothetical protein